MNENTLLRIKKIIKEIDLENIMGDKYLCYDIIINRCNKSDNIEENVKEYIIKNDVCNDKTNINKNDLNDYELEEIKYWIDDLVFIIGNHREFEYDVLTKINELYDILRNNILKAYTIINSKNGKIGVRNDYLYLEDGVTGLIRYYTTEKNDYIVTIVGYD